MINDVYIEYMVKKKNDLKTTLTKVAILFSSLLVCFFALLLIRSMFIGQIALLAAVGSIVLAWYLITGLNLEFEYIYTNGEMDIDKVSAKRKRKRMLTVQISSFEQFDVYDKEKVRTSDYEMVFVACTHQSDEGVYYASFRGKKGQKCLLLFNPNDGIKNAIEAQMKRRRVH